MGESGDSVQRLLDRWRPDSRKAGWNFPFHALTLPPPPDCCPIVNTDSSPSVPTTPLPQEHSGSRGFGLLETFMAISVLSIALMGHLSLSWSSNKLATQQRMRSKGMRLAEQFLERLRSDDDWPTLMSRLDAKLLTATSPTAPLGTKLMDGRVCFAVTEYYPGFVGARPVHEFAVLVDVPGTRSLPGLPLQLTEDELAPEFSLPSDLNGDGVIDSDPRNSDYVGLPVVVYCRYSKPGHPPYELELHTWLRGQRQ